MIFVFILLFVVLLPVFIARNLDTDKDSKWLLKNTSIAVFLFLLILVPINNIYEFSVGGDDIYYYLDSLGQAQFTTYEQPGYSYILAVVNNVAGNSLYARKALNVTFFLLIALCWYRIGFISGGVQLGKLFFTAILLSSPLWYYFFFVLKDMVIILMFSMFFLGVIEFFAYRKGIILMIFSSLLIGFFRLPLVALNIAFLVVTVVMLSKQKRIVKYITSAFVIFILFGYGTDVDLLATIGISPERNISLDNLRRQIDQYSIQVVDFSVFRFILIYLLTETTAFTSFGFYDSVALRGVIALPWIFIGLPLFFAACYFVVRNRMGMDTSRKNLVICLFMAVLSYFLVSIIVKDTTRWRMPAFPAMAAIAALGWDYLGENRKTYLISAMLIGGIAFGGYYFFKV